jgi:hypothetical protein
MDYLGDSEGVYSWGGTDMWGMRLSVGSGHKWLLGEDLSPVTVCLPLFPA